MEKERKRRKKYKVAGDVEMRGAAWAQLCLLLLAGCNGRSGRNTTSRREKIEFGDDGMEVVELGDIVRGNGAMTQWRCKEQCRNGENATIESRTGCRPSTWCVIRHVGLSDVNAVMSHCSSSLTLLCRAVQAEQLVLYSGQFAAAIEKLFEKVPWNHDWSSPSH